MKIKVAKIVGTANTKTWSQVHEFRPGTTNEGSDLRRRSEPNKLKTHGQLMAALSFEAKKEDLQVSSFGTEMITRLQEMYYSNESKSVLKKVEQTMESLKAEFFNEVELEIVMMAVVQAGEQMLLYAGRRGGGQVYLRRGESLVKLLSGDKEAGEAVSGKLLEDDKLVAGTSQFYKMVTRESLESSLGMSDVNEMMESLAAVVHGEEKNSQAAAVVALHSQGKAGKDPAFAGQGRLNPAFAGQGRLKNLTNGIRHSVIGKSRGIIKKLQPKAVRVRNRDPKKQKSAATMALILVLVFGVSLVLAGNKRRKNKRAAEYQSVMDEVSYKYDEAMGLLELNPLRAKSLLTDSKGRIESYKLENDNKINKDLEEFLKKIEDALGTAQREYAVEDASEWFDFSLVKTGFKASDWEVEETKIMVWDKETKTVVEVNLETKASKVVVGGDKIEGGNLVGLAGERGFVVAKDLVTVISSEDEEVVAEVGQDDWGAVVDAVGFSSNLYLLDGTAEGQIYKYLGVKSGLSAQRNYLKGESYDMSEAVSMAIDGAVFVLFSDGTIVKYIQGSKDAFTISGLDEEFGEPVKIFTIPEVENLYILDRQKMRVVVIDKSGEYQAQYRWPGIAGVKDLVVSEDLGKIFMLTKEKIFVITLHSQGKVG